MKILLTGATGFIGSAFLRFAARHGHEVAALSRPCAGARNGPARWIEGTLAEAPWDEIEAFGAETCVHAAWITTPGVYLESPENELYLHTSLDFLGNACKRGVKRVIGIGTCIEYQAGPQPLAEISTPLRPVTTYARCKNTLRAALEARLDAGAFCWARVFYPYGPGESPLRLVSSLIKTLASGQPVTIKTPSSIKDYIYIDDLAEALLAITEAPVSGPINLGTGIGITVGEVAATVATILGKEESLCMAGPAQADPADAIVADATLLRSLGWRPSTGIREGLLRQISHLGFQVPVPLGSHAV